MSYTTNNEIIDQHNSHEFWPSIIYNYIKWFPFQIVMVYKEIHMKGLDDIFLSLLKLCSMIKMRIWYEGITAHQNVPYFLGC